MRRCTGTAGKFMQQRILGSLILTLLAAVAVLIGTGSPAPANTRSAAPNRAPNAPDWAPNPGGTQPEVVADNMHDLMEYVFQPTQQRLQNGLAAEPSSVSEWKAVRSDALFVAESCNLLFTRSPSENVSAWKRHTAATRQQGAALYEAACDQDLPAAATAYSSLMQSCNACHQQFAGQNLLTLREDLQAQTSTR